MKKNLRTARAIDSINCDSGICLQQVTRRYRIMWRSTCYITFHGCSGKFILLPDSLGVLLWTHQMESHPLE